MSSGTEDFLACLRRNGWVQDARATLTPLKGGVSSDIYLVQDGGERFAVKRALAKLRVKDDWFADVSRNASEEAYLRCVGRFLPGAVPQLRFSHPRGGYFGMEYLGEGFVNWKQLLLEGVCAAAHATQAGHILGTIHRQTFGDREVAKMFHTTASFHQLRTSPYLLTTGQRHPRLEELFQREAGRLEATRECLVHGDFSPKNILVREERMVLLDCEVAWYGDPAFDVAFLLNHFLLKMLCHAPQPPPIGPMVTGFWRSYLGANVKLPEAVLEGRVVPLLLMLLLARVDGKSPVEYLDATRRQLVRNFVYEVLPAAPARLDSLVQLWLNALKNLESQTSNE